MHRFLMTPGAIEGDTITLEPTEAHHALRVLRLGVGAQIQIGDGMGLLYSAEIVRIDGPEVSVVLGQALPGTEPPVRLTLYQGLPKFDKLEMICQKATELGAARIVPVKTERSVVKLSDADGERRRERMQKICAEAAKQCGRAAVPQVESPQSFNEALLMMRAEALMLMPWEEAREMSLASVHAAHKTATNIGLFIGPEGGISADEARLAMGIGALPVTLGPRILRTETAAIAATAMVMQLWGDL